MILHPAIAVRLEKAAVDNGFDQQLVSGGDWLTFASTQAPLRLWLTQREEGVFVAAFSQQNVARALSDLGGIYTGEMPSDARGARGVADIPALHHLVRRAFQLSRTLPDELLHTFERVTATLPRTTEAERVVIQRVGQDIFRKGLVDYWEGRCAITGLARTELLRASHIKPWAACETDAERLDIFNGLLLAPHLDALFDAGFITVGEDGAVLISPTLADTDCRILNLIGVLRLRGLADQHTPYLEWHQLRLFRKEARH
jgi:hypothetical protein